MHRCGEPKQPLCKATNSCHNPREPGPSSQDSAAYLHLQLEERYFDRSKHLLKTSSRRKSTCPFQALWKARVKFLQANNWVKIKTALTSAALKQWPHVCSLLPRVEQIRTPTVQIVLSSTVDRESYTLPPPDSAPRSWAGGVHLGRRGGLLTWEEVESIKGDKLVRSQTRTHVDTSTTVGPAPNLAWILSTSAPKLSGTNSFFLANFL